MSFSLHRGTQQRLQTQSPSSQELHHHAKKSTSREAKCPTTTTTCQRFDKKQVVRILTMALLPCLCLDMNDVSSRRRSVYYCHAFQPGSISSSSFHSRKRRSSTKWEETTSLALSSSSVEEEDMDNAFLSDGNFVEETFQERYGSSSSSSSRPPVLPDWLIQKCTDCGWTHPTRIQQRALDVICVDKRDAIIQAETGSGKTLAYLLPALACIDPSRATVQALIVVPTRELGLQVARVAKRLAASSSSTSLENETGETVDGTNNSIGREEKIMVMNVLQGSQNRRQRAWAWAEPPHLIIGTPQELCDMVRFGGIKRYNSVKYVVVDEVDACLLNNAGSSSSTTLTGALSSSTTLLHQLLSKYLSPTFHDGSSNGDENADGSSSSTTSLLSANAKSTNGQNARPVSRKRQTIFASATIPQHRHFLKQVVQNKWTLNLQPPVHVCLRASSSGRRGGGGEQLIPQKIQHAYIVVSPSTSSDENNQNKFTALRSVLQKIFKSNRQNDATMPAKKVLIFAENKRPLEAMAERLALDFERSGGMYWTESSLLHSPEYNKAQAIFAVLRFEDSLTQRAAAMDSLRGEEDQQQAWQSRTTTRRRKQQRQDQPDSVPESYSTDSISNGPEAAAAAPTTTTTTHRQSPVLRVLLSSDLASRGVDIPDLTHVIHFDLPPNADSYLHQAGRTGRLGRSGQVLSIITPEQEFVLQRLANKLNIDIRCLARQ